MSKIDDIQDRVELFAESALSRMDAKSEESNLSLIQTTAMDIGTLGVGLGIFYMLDNFMLEAVGAFLVFIALLGLIGKVVPRI